MLNSRNNLKSKLIISLTLLSIVFCACKKNKTDKPVAIDGTYIFQSMSAKTQNVITSDVEQVVTSEYTTTGNAGTISFNKSTVTFTNLQYNIDTRQINTDYYNGNFLDSLSTRFRYYFQVPTSNQQYQVIGSDSIYFPQSGFLVPIAGGWHLNPVPTGGTFTLQQNQLTIKETVVKDSSWTNQNQPFHLHQTAEATLILEKQ